MNKKIFKCMRNVFFLITLLPVSFGLLAQQESRTLNIPHIDEQITIDGIMDEAIWETAGVADDFWQFFPTDSLLARLPTEVKMLYDDHTIYVGIRAEITGGVVVANLRRDSGGGTNDNVSLMFDTYSDGSNAVLHGQQRPFRQLREQSRRTVNHIIA